MSDPRDEALARELRDLGPWLVTPAPPDVHGAVRERLSAAASAPTSSRRWVAAVAAGVVALIVVVVPPTRDAVAHAASALLRFAGIEFDGESPSGSLPATASPLPGTRSAALDEARRLARFPVVAPAMLGAPDSVQLADADAAGAPRVVSLLYRGGAIRLDEFDGGVEPSFIKGVSATGAVWTNVNGQLAVWIPTPHPVTYVDRNGVRHHETARLAAATLIWEGTDAAYRLEGPLTIEEALEIARSIS